MSSDTRTFHPRSRVRWKPRLRFCIQSSALLLCAFVLPGCENGGGGTVSVGSSAGKAGDDVSQDAAIAPLRPPGADERPLLPGQGAGLAALPGMQPPKGLNLESLFAEDIQDPMARIKRLENVVLDIRRDLNASLPSIMRLVAVEQDMQNLIGQLETLVDQPPGVANLPGEGDLVSETVETAVSEDLSGSTQPPLAPPSVPGEIVETAQAPPATGPPPHAADSSAVLFEAAPVSVTPATAAEEGAVVVRVSALSGKTRLVFEASDTGGFRTDLDLTEKILVVEMPHARGGSAGVRAPIGGAPLVAGWSTQPIEKDEGVRAVVELTGPARILKALALPSGDGKRARIIIDLAEEPAL